MIDRVDFDKYVEQYNHLLREGTAFFSKDDAYFAKYKVDVMKSRLSKPVRRLLDYGCGIGRNIPSLKEAFPGAEVVGTDISRASLAVAHQDNPDVEFVHDDMSYPGPFDLILVACVFHHVPVNERLDVFGKLYRNLGSPGDLFVFEHNPYNPITRRIVSKCEYDKDAVLLTPGELRRHASMAGFKSSHTGYCLFFPPRFQSLARLERRLRWLPLGGQYFVHASK